ncbi:MAG: transposase [Desulfobacterales bacterium]|nr:transposase [Desulfobacterales bacterium]
MARAKRHYLPGHVWHITHRCHKKEFLLKFARDRRRWLQWLFEAKKRYGLCVLNYMVTSNHIHLLVVDGGERKVIPKSIQLIAGRTGQEYNQRKNRNGAYWEDRYHATAVSSDRHLIECIVYIDLNMVRAGVVTHPSEWDFGGYNEIQNPRERYALIDYKRLMDLFHFSTVDQLRNSHKKWVEEILKTKNYVRESKWSQSIAVGSKSFVEGIKEKLGILVKGRKLIGSNDLYQLRELRAVYNSNFASKNIALSTDNKYFWNVNP